MSHKFVAGLFALLIAGTTTPAFAQSQAPTGAGFVNPSFGQRNTISPSANIITGVSGGAQYRSFVTFAVPASVNYVTAELQLSAATVNGGPNALGVYDVTTNVATDTLANIYADLGTGTSYGTATGIASGDTIVVTLNAQGLAAVNAAKGSSITFGLTNTTIEANADNIFAGSNASSSRLVLNTSQPAPVPTLSEWAMILFGTILAGGAALYIQRRRFTV